MNKINNENVLKLIAENIRHYRLDKNMTQQELELSTGLSTCYVSRLENCTKDDILLSTLIKICNVLNIELTDLLSIKKKKPKKKDKKK